jgi:poly(A) polymerase Pap1
VRTIKELTDTVIRRAKPGAKGGNLNTDSHFRVEPFGYYGLGVHCPRSDMDILVVSSNCKKREVLVTELLKAFKNSDRFLNVEVKHLLTVLPRTFH